MAPSTAATASLPTLTQNGARVALQAAEQHALEIGVPMYDQTLGFQDSRLTFDRSIAVVDAHTHLLSFTRMDGAKITSIDTAMNMAFAAAGNRIPTSASTSTITPLQPKNSLTFASQVKKTPGPAAQPSASVTPCPAAFAPSAAACPSTLPPTTARSSALSAARLGRHIKTKPPRRQGAMPSSRLYERRSWTRNAGWRVKDKQYSVCGKRRRKKSGR